MVKLVYLIVFIWISKNSVFCERKDIQHMMYKNFKDGAMCFRTLNGTNQFGCSTTQSGSTGVVHFVNSDKDLQWLLTTGKAGPYMAVVPQKLFVKGVMMQLRSSPQVSGVLLFVNDTDRPQDMSPDDTCPNRYSSLSGSCDDSAPWNPLGSAFLLVDWMKPLFVVKDWGTLQEIHDCFVKFNLPLDDSQVGRSLCSLQMTGHMFAAVDTPTCMRRNSLVGSMNPLSYCDPMGDQNVVTYLFARSSYEAALNNSLVVVTAGLDAASMFDGLAPGALTTVSGIVTLLTVAHLVSQLLPEYKDTYKKNVMFALVNGETQDYIGSSRMVYDMQQSKFPQAEIPTLLEHVHQVIDLHQLDATGKLHLHCFNSTIAQNTVDLLMKSGNQFGVVVEGSCSASSRLPPSSLHSFLKANKSIPGVILTNHADQYTNRYYNGLLDDSVNLGYKYANGSLISETSIQSSLAKVTHSLAFSLARLVDEKVEWPSNITTNSTATLVDELLYCYLESRQCSMFTNVSGGVVEGTGPLPLYVGIPRSLNRITSLTSLTLSQLTGKPTNASANVCKSYKDPAKKMYRTYVWMRGLQVCLETGIYFTPAVSPAFSIENYNWTSGEFSTWTESVWSDLNLRMFLRPSLSQQITTLVCGLAVLVLSFVAVYWINRNADEIFNPLAPSESESLKDTTFLLGPMTTTVMYGNVSV